MKSQAIISYQKNPKRETHTHYTHPNNNKVTEVNSHWSLILIKINWLNSLIERHRLSEWMQKQILLLRMGNTPELQRYTLKYLPIFYQNGLSKKNNSKCTNSWNLNNWSLYHYWVKELLRKEVKDFQQFNGNECTTHPNLRTQWNQC